MIQNAADNIRHSFERAHDRLSKPLTDRDRLHKAGPQHRHRKHGWDFNTLGVTWLVRHARRHAVLGELAPTATLGALAVPAGLLSVTCIGLIPKVAAATLNWPWYYGYEDAQGDDSLRKDLVAFELQEALAELQVVATHMELHPCHKAALRLFWRDAGALAQDFKTHLHSFDPKIGGSYRLRRKLRHYDHLLKTLAPAKGL